MSDMNDQFVSVDPVEAVGDVTAVKKVRSKASFVPKNPTVTALNATEVFDLNLIESDPELLAAYKQMLGARIEESYTSTMQRIRATSDADKAARLASEAQGIQTAQNANDINF